jgi:hypothetical protein
MSIRDTRAYKIMNSFDACAFIEGFSGEEATQEQLAAAWQYIYDEGLHYQLQGFYGRTIHDMLDNGLIEA